MVIRMTELAQRAKEQLAQVTGFNPVAVVGVVKDNGGWQVTTDLLEMSRLPESSDLLGTYVATLDEEGNLVMFEKRRCHLRGETYGEEKS